MEWTHEVTSEFLNLYGNETVLWDPKSEGHKNRNDQHESWIRIQGKMKCYIGDGITVKELKKKRDSLMATYRKIRGKIKDSLRTGSGAEDIYKPDWPFYTTMSTFLDGVYKPRKTKDSCEPEDKEETEVDDEETMREIDNNGNDGSKQDNGGSEKPFKTPKHPPKRSKMQKVEEKMDEAYNYFKQLAQKPEQDECSLYTELLCKKLRGLHEKTREVAMLEIDKLIYQLKQNEIQNQSSSHSETQTQSVSYQLQPLNYQHLYNFQPFHRSATHNAYHQYSVPQPSPDLQMYNPLPPSPFHPTPSPQPSPTFHATPIPQTSPTFHATPSPQPSPTFHGTLSPQPSSPFHPTPSPQPSPTFHATPSPQPSPKFHGTPSPQPSSPFHPTYSPQPSPTFHATASPQPSPKFHGTTSPQPSSPFHPTPSSQPSATFHAKPPLQPSPNFHATPSPQSSSTFHPSPSPNSAHALPASKISLKEFYDLEVQDMFK